MVGLSISTSLLLGTLEEKLQLAAAAGFTEVDINALDVTTAEQSPQEIAKLAKAQGLRINKFQPMYDLEGLEEQACEYAFASFEAKLQIANALGAKMVLLGSSSVLESSSDTDLIVSHLRRAAQLAHDYKLKLAYLALPWAANVRDTLEAYALVEAVDHPAFGLAISSYFALANSSKPARYKALDGKKIFSVQLVDAPLSDFDISHFKHEFANLPGLGSLNLHHFVRLMLTNGYTGNWSLARMGRLQSLRKDRAFDCYRALVNLLDYVQTSATDFDCGVTNLPKRDQVTGFEFLEFTVDDKSGAQLRELLLTLCFRLERKHKTKPVELWRQGAINLVLNFSNEGFAHEAFKNGGPGLCDVGLRVGDANRTVARAQALGIKAVSRKVGEGELDIPAIEGVGHSLLHFVDEKSNLHRVWNIEFDPTKVTAAIAPAGLRRIDHLAQTMRNEKLDSWLLFYLSVFDMKKSALVDVADPFGVVYSRALESADGEVRLNLNGASSHHTLSGNFLADRTQAGVQHIAFATDNIFETAERLSQTGFHRLPMPDNYYTELQVRFALDSAFIAQLQAENILYSRTAKGEYFQLYSQTIWGGFFVEIVQRRGDYAGYGARNAPVRLAAQNRHTHTQGAVA